MLEDSNHTPILLFTSRDGIGGIKPYKFFKAWTKDSSSHLIVKETWSKNVLGGIEGHGLARRLSNTTRALKYWNRAQFGFTQSIIKQLEEELLHLQFGDNGISPRQREVEQELREHRQQLESIYRQKSIELWLAERDKNSNFFHASLVMKRKRNLVSTINEGNSWVHGQVNIGAFFTKKLNELFTTDNPNIPDSLDIEDLIILDEENSILISIPSKRKLKQRSSLFIL